MYEMNEVDAEVTARLRERQVEKRVEEKLKLVEEFGDDTFVDQTILYFKKTFAQDGTEYTYAAIKVGRFWYTTGPNGGKYRWNELVGWLVGGEVPTSPTHVIILTPKENLADMIGRTF